MVKADRLVQRLIELCATDSGSRRERQLADRMRAELQTLGFAVEEDAAATAVGGDTGNLVARLPGRGPRSGAPPVLLSAHLDRVANGTGVRPAVRDGRVESAGETILGADDAAGLAVILEAAAVLRERDLPHPPIEAVLTVCEEVGLLGALALDFTRLRSPMGFVLDAEGPVGGIVVEGPAQARLVATFIGKAAHAGVAPEQGVSAIEMAARAIAAMPLGRIDAETTANIGLIKGGVARNIVPELCEVTGEARSRNDAKLEAQIGRMTAAMETAARQAGGRVALHVEQAYGGFRLDPGAPVVARAAAAARACGLEPALRASGGGSDANIFNARGGIPTVALCAGYQHIHSTAESMPVAELVRLAELTLAILTDAG